MSLLFRLEIALGVNQFHHMYVSMCMYSRRNVSLFLFLYLSLSLSVLSVFLIYIDISPTTCRCFIVLINYLCFICYNNAAKVQWILTRDWSSSIGRKEKKKRSVSTTWKCVSTKVIAYKIEPIFYCYYRTYVSCFIVYYFTSIEVNRFKETLK